MNTYMVLDTETTNSMDDPLTYDIGYSIITEFGHVLEEKSFVVADVFLNKDFMNSAYYAEKLPQYFEGLRDGSRTMRTLNTIKKILKQDFEKYGCSAIVAHNALFDYKALQTTQRYLTKSKNRYFFPYGSEIWDTLKMARQTFGKNENYINFCFENGYVTKHKKPRPQLTAEVLYRYITQNTDFIESHTGLEDTQIEREILLKCLEMDSTIECRLWAD